MTREAIAAAALRCFERYGPQRTSMSDIADEAAISRQSLYRVYEDRSTLIAELLNQRISDLALTLAPQFSAFATIEEALVEGSLLSNRVGRDDWLLAAIVTTSLDHSLELFLLKGSPEIDRSMMSYWGPILNDARDQGRLRPDISNEDILEWLRHVHTVLLLRDDQDEDAQRTILKRFLVPAIVRDARA